MKITTLSELDKFIANPHQYPNVIIDLAGQIFTKGYRFPRTNYKQVKITNCTSNYYLHFIGFTGHPQLEITKSTINTLEIKGFSNSIKVQSISIKESSIKDVRIDSVEISQEIDILDNKKIDSLTIKNSNFQSLLIENNASLLSLDLEEQNTIKEKIFISKTNFLTNKRAPKHHKILLPSIVSVPITFSCCKFDYPVDFSKKEFEDDVVFNENTTFNASANFEGVKFHSNVLFENVTFMKSVSFSHSKSLGGSSKFRIKKVTFTDDALFPYLEMHSTFIISDSSEFRKEVKFNQGKFFNNFTIMDSSFYSITDLTHSVFVKGSAIYNVKFKGNLIMHSCQFSESCSLSNNTLFEKDTSFTESIFEKGFNLNKISFHGAVDFTSSQIKQDSSITGVTFKKNSSFESTTFTQALTIKDTVFNKKVTFLKMEVSELDISNSNFKAEVSFKSSRVRKSTNWNTIILESDTDLSFVNWQKLYITEKSVLSGINLQDTSIAYLSLKEVNLNEEIHFNKIKLIGPSQIDHCNFEKEVFFNDQEFKHPLTFYKTEFHNALNLSEAKFREKVRFHDCKFKEQVIFNNTKFLMLIDFWASTFHKKTIFYKTDFLSTAVFSSTVFKENALFTYTLIESNLILRLTQFNKGADISLAIRNGQIHPFKINIENFKSIPKTYLIESLKKDLEQKYITDGMSPIEAKKEAKKISNIDILRAYEELVSFNKGEIPTENKRETFKILKKYSLDDGNKIGAIKFHDLETKTHFQELRQKLFSFRKYNLLNISDFFILGLNFLSNNNGKSWFWGVVFTILVGIIFSYLSIINTSGYDLSINPTDWYKVDYQRLGKIFIEFMTPTHSFNYLNTYKGLESVEIYFGSYIFDFLGRIFIAYGVYQTVLAFRRFSRNI